jgi:hypothetical protein
MSTTTSQTPNTSNSYLFIEEVLFLHERMIECYRYDDDDEHDDNSNNQDSKPLRVPTMAIQGRQQQQRPRQLPLQYVGTDRWYIITNLSRVRLLAAASICRVLRHFDEEAGCFGRHGTRIFAEQSMVQHGDNDNDKMTLTMTTIMKTQG